jgi:hypothetical protein
MIANSVVRWLPCAALALLAVAAGAGLVRELTWLPPLPPPPPVLSEPAPSPVMVAARHRLSGPVETAQYAIIAVRNLFSASRAEQGDAEATVATGPRPYLHGVVLDGDRSRAYLEDPTTQRVAGYRVGDAVGGGTLVRILEDRVVIRRPEGLVEVMLKDPSKPQPAPASPAAPAPPAPGAPAAPGPVVPPGDSATPAGPGLPAPPAPGGPSAEIVTPRTPPPGPR